MTLGRSEKRNRDAVPRLSGMGEGPRRRKKL
jgi:hypothetical protein